MATASEEFFNWLPSEMEYSVRKAPYTKKVLRAHNGTDPDSIYGFLGAEWFHAQHLRILGRHHSENHEKTAQLQYAKFAAGLLDKAGMLLWLQQGGKQTIDAQVYSGLTILSSAVSLLKSPYNEEECQKLLETPFDETPFAEGIISVQNIIVAGDTAEFGKAQNSMTTLSHLALGCYLEYAAADLAEGQFILAKSVLKK